MLVITPKSLKDVWPALTGLSAVFLIEMLDNSILNIALPTIARELHASSIALQWINNSYSIVFGGLMLTFGALADRSGRRRMMLLGLSLLTVTSLLTLAVQNPCELIIVRMLTGIAAAMTTPGTISLAFRLFEDDKLRIRAISAISTVGLVGLAAGPVLGGLLLSLLPWQSLLLINAPIAMLAFIGIRIGIPPEQSHELHPAPIDIVGALLGTTTIILCIASPTLFVDLGANVGLPWMVCFSAILFAIMFVFQQRNANNPLIDTSLIGQRLVASGLAYKSATGLAMGGLGYMVSLQLQLYWGWSPILASLGMLPLVSTLLVTGFFVERFVNQVGIHRAAWFGSLSILCGLVVYTLLGRSGYAFVAITLICVAVGLRIVGVVAGVNVMKGTPKSRTSIGAALVDTIDQTSSAVSVAVAGTILATVFSDDLAKSQWTAIQKSQFAHAALYSSSVLTIAAALLIIWAYIRTGSDN